MKFEREKELKELGQLVARKSKVLASFEDLTKQKEEVQENVSKLCKIAEKEQLDVDKMERLTISSIIYKIAGKKEEKIQKEKAEAYTAAMKYQSAKEQLEYLEREIELIQKEWERIYDGEERYKVLLKEKEKWLSDNHIAGVEKILKKEKKLAIAETQSKELTEALEAGERVLEVINNLYSKLDSAESYATWDLMGGGFVADMLKYSELDDVQVELEHLRRVLGDFRTELADVEFDVDIHVEIDGFTRMADYFFDGFFVDWSVMDKIEKGKNAVDETKTQVEDVIEALEENERTVEQQKENLQEEIAKLIIEAAAEK